MKKLGITISICSLLIVTALTFSPSLQNGFVNWDDPVYVIGNETIRDLSRENLRTIFTTYHRGLYKPLVLLSFAVEYRFFGPNPTIYHATNLLIHLLNCLLVFWLVRSLGSRAGAAFIAALLFGIHPLRVESVAWITERKDLLYGLFFLLSSISYLRYRKNGRSGDYCLSLFLFLLSLLAKPQGLALPFVLFLFDYLRGRRLDRKSIGEKLPYLALAALFIAITVAGKSVPEGHFSVSLPNLPNAAYALGFYLLKLAVPTALSSVYPPPGRSLLFFSSPFILAAFFIWTLASARTDRVPLFAALFFLVNLLVVLPFYRLGTAPVADRYTYIPSIGLFYLAGEAFIRLYLQAGRRKPFLVLPAAAFVLLAILSYLRCRVWEDGESLWKDALSKHPNVAIAHRGLGDALFERGRIDGAIHHYIAALRLKPEFADVHANLGVVLVEAGRGDEAVPHYLEAIRLQPDDAETHNNLAIVLAGMGRLEEAVPHFAEVTRLRPDDFASHYNLGKALLARERTPEAILHLETALRLNPGLETVRELLDSLNRPPPPRPMINHGGTENTEGNNLNRRGAKNAKKK